MFFSRITRRRAADNPPRQVLSCRPKLEMLEDRRTPTVVAPTGLQLAALTPTQVRVTWTDVAGEEGYHVWRWDGKEAKQIGSTDANETAFTDNTAKANSKYWYLVESFDGAGVQRTSWLSVITPSTPVTVPTNLRCTAATTNSLRLTWGDSQGETGYNVYKWTGEDSVKLATLPANATTYLATGLQAGSTYYFYVEAFNDANRAATSWKPVATNAIPITNIGTLKTTTISTTRIDLSWNNANNETGYRVFQLINNQPVVIANLARNVTRYSVSNLAPGKLYYFYVEAFNNGAAIATGWKTGITRPAAPLPPPIDLRARVINGDDIRLTFGGSTQAAGYDVLMFNGTTWTQIKTTLKGAGLKSYTVPNLLRGRSYWFIVQAYTANHVQVTNSTAILVRV